MQNNKFTPVQIESLPEKKNRLIVFLLFLVLVPSVLYFRVVNFEFSRLDDVDIISSNYDSEGNLKNIKEAFTHDAFMSDTKSSFYRPVQTVSFMLDAQIGGKQPWIYHLSNLLIHIFSVIALFFFLIKIGINKQISFLLALFFSIHPLFTNAVAWIPARGDLLLCLFSLLSIISFLNYFDHNKTIYFLLHCSVFLLAQFSKETAILLPFLIVTFFYFTRKKKYSIKDIAPFLILWSLSFILFFYLRQDAIKIKLIPGIFGIIPLIKNLPTIPVIFGKFIIPFNLSSLPMFDTLSLIIGIVLIVLFIALIIKFSDGQKRIVIWGAIWFLAFLFPPMLYRSYLAELGIEYFEYRAYLPMIGIIVIIGSMTNEMLSKFLFNKILLFSVPVLIIYAIIAFIHSADFTNPMSFFSSAINANSTNAFALNSRGIEFSHLGNKNQSMEDYESAIKISPYYSTPYYSKGNLYHSMGENIKAEYCYSQALKYDTLMPQGGSLHFLILYNYAGEKLILKKYDDAIFLLKKAAAEFPNNSELYNNLGYAYFSTARYDSAIYSYSRALVLQPNSASYYTNRGKIKYIIKDFQSALSDYKIALELEPNIPDSWFNIGVTKLDLKNYEGAISDLSTAIRMNPNWGEAFYQRGVAYSKLNKPVEAEKDWVQARNLGFKIGINEK